MGPAHKLAKMWKWALDNQHEDDQIAVGTYANLFPQDIFLDYYSIFFYNDPDAQTNYQVQETNDHYFIISEDNGNTIKKPFFLHFPGINGKTSIPILQLFNSNGLFEVGINYKNFGKIINGDDHITSFPSEKRGLKNDIYIERGIFLILYMILLIILSVLIASKYKKKKSNKRLSPQKTKIS